MRKLLLAVLPLVTTLCAIVPCAAARPAEAGRLAWRALGPLDLGRYRLPANVMALAIDPASSGTVYVGTRAGVFVLEDTGAFPIPPERTPSTPRPVGFRSGP
jgi:hypothetical protein